MPGFMPGIHGFFRGAASERHCERSEAIQLSAFARQEWITPRNDNNDTLPIIHAPTGLTTAGTVAISTPPGTSGLSAFGLDWDK